MISKLKTDYLHIYIISTLYLHYIYISTLHHFYISTLYLHIYRSDYLPDPNIPHGAPRAVPLSGGLHGGQARPQLLSRLQTAGQIHLESVICNVLFVRKSEGATFIHNIVDFIWMRKKIGFVFE